MRLLIALALAALAQPALAAADPREIFPLNPILVESHRKDGKRFGKMQYTYEMGAAPAFTLDKKLKGAIDVRPYKDRHPRMHFMNKCRSGLIWMAPVAGAAVTGLNAYGQTTGRR